MTIAMGNERLLREIEHHRRLGDHPEIIWNWDSPSGRRRARRRAEFFVSAGGLRPGVRALELGCGTGVFLELVAPCGADIHGLDLSTHLLSRARQRQSRFPNLRLHCGNAETMPFPDATFDTVYGSSVLHHLDLENAVREIHRVLRPGGVACFAEPNIVNPQVAVMFHLGMTKEYFGVSPDEMAFSRFRARRVLAAAGFAAIDVRPYDFLHPATPGGWIDGVERFGRLLERVPVVREIAGSMLIQARKGGT